MRRLLYSFPRASSIFFASRNIVIGYTDAGKKDAKASYTKMSDIIGNPATHHIRLPAGDILGMMDICAARCALRHITGLRMVGTTEHNKLGNTSVATVAVDNTAFRVPVLHGDFIMVRGIPIYAGRSSVGVHVEVLRSQFPTRELQSVCDSFFTMVAINKELSKSPIVPALELTNESDIALHERYKRGLGLRKKGMELISALNEKTNLVASEIETEINRNKIYKIPMESTICEASRHFFPSSLNFNNTIFGGELMRWMEAHARRCAMHVTSNKNIVAVGMHSVAFNSAVHLTDFVELEASVAYIHNSTMEIDVNITVERDNNQVTTNKASFVFMNLDEVGQRRCIRQGLNLEIATKEQLRKYAIAKTRYEISRKKALEDHTASKHQECH